jgi:hypothetical protein
MKYIEPAEIAHIKKIDLLTYLRQCEPDELVRIGADSYTTKTHDSLKLSNNKWYWWSQGFGGKTALDYLIKVKGLSFLEAAHKLGAKEIEAPKQRILLSQPKKSFALPLPAKTNDLAVSYLRLRDIDQHVISHCIKAGLIYATEKRNITNVVFVGNDALGHPRYGAIRAIVGDFKGEAPGSDKRFSFRLASRTQTDTVHVFEGAIDALSFATLVLNTDQDWRDLNLLSLGGIPPAGGQREQTRLPQALTQFLSDNPRTKRVHLHMDNDAPGINAANMIASALTRRNFDVSIAPTPRGTDVNDYLMLMHKNYEMEDVELNEDRLMATARAAKRKAAKEKAAKSDKEAR